MEVSKAEKDLKRVSAGSLFVLLCLGIAIHVFYLAVNFALSRVVPMDNDALKAFVITSSQKALSSVVAVLAFFPESAGVKGLIVLPGIIAHFTQIAMDGMSAPLWLKLRHVPTAPLAACTCAGALLPPRVCLSSQLLLLRCCCRTVVHCDPAASAKMPCAVMSCGAVSVCCAVLCCAVLCCAVLCCAVLCCAVLCCAVRCGAVLRPTQPPTSMSRE
jgi:hypothetical protein